MDTDNFIINCTGDVVAGDTIRFTEAVFSGSYRKPKFAGDRIITARVARDSYGAAKQQHTFTLEIIACEGAEPIAAGTVTTRKGRNVYRNGTMRQPWTDESARKTSLEDKHARGDAARSARDTRRMETFR